MSIDPSTSLISAENALRDLIRHVMREQHGDDWIEHLGVTDERLTRWKDRQIEESKRRAGRSSGDRGLLEFSDLPDLTTIIGKDWPEYKDSLGSKKTFDVYMERLESFRVAVMHSRDLLPFERQILSGISGELRNRVTIALAGSDPDRRYFPRIEVARDSFGNESTEDDDYVQTGLTLRVGDVVRYEASGWDPENAELAWEFITPAKPEKAGSGTEVSWDWRIGNDDVGVDTSVWVSMTADREYHKYHGYDSSLGFGYRVLPR